MVKSNYLLPGPQGWSPEGMTSKYFALSSSRHMLTSKTLASHLISQCTYETLTMIRGSLNYSDPPVARFPTYEYS